MLTDDDLTGDEPLRRGVELHVAGDLLTLVGAFEGELRAAFLVGDLGDQDLLLDLDPTVDDQAEDDVLCRVVDEVVRVLLPVRVGQGVRDEALGLRGSHGWALFC